MAVEINTGPTATTAHHVAVWVAEATGMPAEYAMAAVITAGIVAAAAAVCAIGAWAERRTEGKGLPVYER